MEKEACGNCRHNVGGLGYSSIESLSGSHCRCSTPGFPWHIYHRYRRYPNVMPRFCGHYEARCAGKCRECGVDLGPTHLVQYWACGVFSVVPCCSPSCLAAQQSRLDAELETIANAGSRLRDVPEYVTH